MPGLQDTAFHGSPVPWPAPLPALGSVRGRLFAPAPVCHLGVGCAQHFINVSISTIKR